MDALLESVGWPMETREQAKRVAACESGWRTHVVSPTNDYGLFQINGIHYDATLDPVGNALAALRISGGGYNWQPWSCKP